MTGRDSRRESEPCRRRELWRTGIAAPVWSGHCALTGALGLDERIGPSLAREPATASARVPPVRGSRSTRGRRAARTLARRAMTPTQG